MRRIALLGLALWGGSALAQTGCPVSPPMCNDTVAIPNPVYINSGDTQVPVLHRLGRKLRFKVDGVGAAAPTSIVYIPNGSCSNIANQFSSPAPKFTTGTAGGPFFIPGDATFDITAKTACPCVNPTGPSAIKPDMAITIVVPDNVSCPSNPATPPATIGVFKGPVQGMTFVVPFDTAASVGSSQRAITAEEAYLVMGLGAENAQVAPWNDSHFILGRPASKGTQVSIGANILVPAAKWRLLTANAIDQSSDLASMLAALATDANAEKALGILGTEIYDKNRGKLHALAFRGFNQRVAYWPDSKLSTSDKANVRDGHYVLWSYVQYLAPVTSGMAKASVQEIIDALTSKSTSVTFNDGTGQQTADPIDDLIVSGLVPQCAMKVQRPGGEGSNLSRYDAPEPCSCYFDKKATGATTCAVCDVSIPCASGTCRRGFCEAK